MNKSSLKILQVGKYYHPFKGGMESVLKSICEGVTKSYDDFEVSVICSSENMKTSKERINGVWTHKIGRWFSLFSQTFNPTFVYHYLKAVKNVDIVHLHTPNPLAELLVFLFTPRHVKVTITHHSDVIRQKFIYFFYSILQKIVYDYADSILVPTNNHIKFSPIVSLFKEKCVIIPFGLDVSFGEKTQEIENIVSDFRNKHGEYGLFVGRLVGYKGIDILIKSLKNTNGKILLIGNGPLYEDLNSLAIKENVRDKIEFIGHVDSDDEFKAYFHASRFFVLPSVDKNENFGVVQLEAMACKKPVIVTNLESGVPAVGIKGETTFIVKPSSPEELAEKMNVLFENDVLIKKMGERGYQHLMNNYTMERFIKLHRDHYFQLGKLSDQEEFEQVNKKKAS